MTTSQEFHDKLAAIPPMVSPERQAIIDTAEREGAAIAKCLGAPYANVTVIFDKESK
jgi:hypothetical protein